MAVSKQCKQLICYLYTLLLLVLGVLLLILSILLGYKLVYYFKLIPSESIAPFILIFLLGIGHIAVTWIAIKGLHNEYLFYIILFIVLTLAMLISEAAIGAWSLIIMRKLNITSIKLMESSLDEFKESFFKYNKIWDSLQPQFQCCGINGVRDYRISKEGAIPSSCCVTSTINCTNLYESGCGKYVVDNVKQLLLYIGLAGFASALFQILGIISFSYYYKAVKQQAAEEAKRRASIVQEINLLSRQQSTTGKNVSPTKSQ